MTVLHLPACRETSRSLSGFWSKPRKCLQSALHTVVLFKANGSMRTHKVSPLIIKSQIISINSFSEASYSDVYLPYRSTFDERCCRYFGVNTEVVRGCHVCCHSSKLIALPKTRRAKVSFPIAASQCLVFSHPFLHIFSSSSGFLVFICLHWQFHYLFPILANFGQD